MLNRRSFTEAIGNEPDSAALNADRRSAPVQWSWPEHTTLRRISWRACCASGHLRMLVARHQVEAAIKLFHRERRALDLSRLLSCPDADFEHDVLGIWGCYRVSGELHGDFTPRCAMGVSSESAAK